MKKQDKISHFNFFIKNFWNDAKINNNGILRYDQECRSRVSKKIEEFLNLSMYNKLTTIENKPDVILFPENTIPENMIENLIEYSKKHKVLIIGGLEHVNNEESFINSVVLIDHGMISRQKKQTPVWIWNRDKKEYMKENIQCARIPKITIFNTSIGRIALFICKDFLRLSEIIPYWVERNQIDFVVIPSLTAKVLPFQARLLSVLNYPQCKNTKFLFINIGEYGGSELFSVKDNWRIEENFRKTNFDNLGERIIIRKVDRIKEKYLELVSNEIDKCRQDPEKLNKLYNFKDDIEEDHIPYTFVKNLFLKWKDGYPRITESSIISILKTAERELNGFCIRCHIPIPYDSNYPFCYNDWQEWKRWNNPFYKEKFCHKCGKEYQGTFRKPLCEQCFKNNGDVV